MFCTFGPDRNADVDGVTTSSSLVSITTYLTVGSVPPPALRAVRNGDPATCSTHASQVVDSWASTVLARPMSSIKVAIPSNGVPWWDGESAVSTLTLEAPPRLSM